MLRKPYVYYIVTCVQPMTVQNINDITRRDLSIFVDIICVTCIGLNDEQKEKTKRMFCRQEIYHVFDERPNEKR